MSVIFFLFIPAGLIIFLCVQVKLLFPASVPAIQREWRFCCSVKHINGELEKHCRDVGRGKKGKKWKKQHLFHLFKPLSIRMHKMLCSPHFLPHSHSVYISREEFRIAFFNWTNPQNLLGVFDCHILSEELSPMSVWVGLCCQQCSNKHHIYIIYTHIFA